MSKRKSTDLLGRRTSTPFKFTPHQEDAELQHTVIMAPTGKGMSAFQEAAPDTTAADNKTEQHAETLSS